MKIVHVADTHLGYSAYRALCSENGPYKGINLREVDVCRAFEHFVDSVIEMRPDAVLHSGDLFDSVRPSNRTLGFAMEQLLRLSKEEIPFIVIAGNHSIPRIRETGSAFRLFDHISGISCIYRGGYEQVKAGDMTVHAVPYREGEEYASILDKISPADSRYNVMMLHTGVSSIKAFQNSGRNEQVIEDSYLQNNMDYVALGHYHKYQKILDNVYYSGSTERFSFAEAREEKGYITVDLDKGTSTFTALPARRMIDIPYIDALHLDAESLMHEVENCMPDMIEGALVRMTINNLLKSVKSALNIKKIRESFADAVHFELRMFSQSDDFSVQAASSVFDTVENEFLAYVDARPLEKIDKGRIKKLGLEYLQKGAEQSD